MNQRVAVDLGSRSQKQPGAFGARQSQRVVSAQRADFEGLNRQFEVIHRRGGRGEVEDEIHRAVDEDAFGDVLLAIGKRRGIDVGDVVGVAGDEVVDRDNFVAFGQTTVAQMGAEKPGAAGDDDTHGIRKRTLLF